MNLDSRLLVQLTAFALFAVAIGCYVFGCVWLARNRKKKEKFVVVSFIALVVIPIIPVASEPDHFGLVPGYLLYRLFLFPVENPVASAGMFLKGIAYLSAVLSAHVGLSLLIPALVTKNDANQAEVATPTATR